MMGRVAGAGVLGLMMVIAGLLPTPALAQVRYICLGGPPIVVDYGGRHAEIEFQGVRYFLPQVPMVEGSRYSDGRFTWTVTRDQVGTLTHDGNVLAHGCRTGFFSQPGVPTLPGGQAIYTCATGGTVTAAYSGSTALVTFRGRTHTLQQVPLYEGSRYTDGRFTWTISRAHEGTLTRNGAVIARDCRTGFVSQPGGIVLPGGPTIPGGPTLPGGFAQTVYTCAGGGSVVASYSGSTAVVTFQGNTYRLVQVPLADGTRYTDGRLTWTVNNRGDEGTLTHFGTIVAQGCRNTTFQPREPER